MEPGSLLQMPSLSSGVSEPPVSYSPPLSNAMRSAFYRSDSELLGWLEVGSSSADPIHLHVFRLLNC